MAPPNQALANKQDQSTDNAQPAQTDQESDEQTGSSAARKASNASMLAQQKKHRELGQSKHIAAAEASFGTAQDGLEVLSRQFYDLSVSFMGIAGNTQQTDAGNEVEQKQAQAAVTGVETTLDRVVTLIEVLDPAKKASLSASVGKVQGSFSSFKQPVVAMMQHRHISVSLGGLEDKIAKLSVGMNSELVKAEKLQPTEKPTETIDKALIASAEKHLISLEIDVQSVEAGNWDDVHQINVHASSLADLHDAEGVELKPYAAKLLDLSSRIDQLSSRASGRLANALSAMKRIHHQ